jgi:transmembrane sensor
MAGPETSREINDAAAQWAARIDRGPLSPEDSAALDAWVSADSRRLGALAKAQAVSVHSERARALGVGFNPERQQTQDRSPGVIRRTVLVGTAAAAVGGIAVLPRIAAWYGTRTVTTRLGETRVITLEDGSVITLNTASQLAVAYTDRRRDVTLVEGEALFDVAKDPARPFVVEAGVARVRAVGTSFSVLALLQRPVTVLVREGVIELNRPQLPNTQGMLISANTRAIAPASAPIVATTISSDEVERELSWREGRIAFEGSSLAEAAATFARYSDTRIIIGERSLEGRRITGLFVSNDPVGFANAVALSLGVHVRIGDEEVVLIP